MVKDKKQGGRAEVNEHAITLDEIAALITNGSTKNVVICAGAGISTAAGIPDFRSPKTGLYHNLKKLKLDYPEQVFEIDFFRRKPEPFFQLAQELYPAKFKPTLTHCFIKMLHDKKLLLQCFTQNIDTLERRAGIPDDKIVEAHGSFAGNHCISPRCGAEADSKLTEETIMQQKIPRCDKCGSLVKPDIVFFGEGLPEVFFERIKHFGKADLLLVMGTSLQVQPFASLPDRVRRDCPRVLLNLEEVGHFTRPLDVVHIGKCDESVQELARLCGFEKDLQDVFEQFHGKPKKEESLPAETHTKGEGAIFRDEKDDHGTSEVLQKIDGITAKLEKTNL